MKRKNWMCRGVGTLLTLALLSGCTPTEGAPTAPATPTATTPAIEAGEKTIDGTPIQATTAVAELKDLTHASPSQYFEVGGLRVTKLQDGIYHVDEGTVEHPDGPDNNGSSIYLLIGEETAAMIDGGNGEVGNANFSDADMEKIVNTLVGDRVLKVLITHSHGDHTGLFVDEDSYSVIPADVPIYIGEGDVDFLAERVKEKYSVTMLKDGEEIEAGGRTLHIISMPGHSHGSIALADYEKEVIFSGDAIGSGTVWLFYENNMAEYNDSIRKLANVAAEMDDPIFYAGHRWQQSNAMASTASRCVEEMGKVYVMEMVALMDDIKIGNNKLSESYPPDASGENLPMYSESDLNQDGIVPGVYATHTAAAGFVPASD